MKVVCRTDRGKVRNHNEDHVGIFTDNDGNSLAVVADGMGGHLAGDVASRMTIELIQQLWETDQPKITTAENAIEWFTNSIQMINEKIYHYANENPECKGMGTTFVAALCTENFVTVAHIGDSRCYILNSHGFQQLTDDHSLVNELVKSGQISKEDAEHHPRKNVLLRALGTEPAVQIDTVTVELEVGDYIILCTDGLSNKVSDSEIKEVLKTEQDLAEKADRLIQMANDNGGEDNITLAIIYKDHLKAGDD
ncbi:Stp1/IreP family PP2C-type Ser/Thr phosphatase [Bacillus andreraoultii]|uniref:Stp1/IreP family PP2C-type Ser/Thr phosphatase n=1 Tax=Bacillus andreraoultii TaxID=1499685 RepID=UPI00053A5C00|nr:Stp1/IreP family PP2C-type Ser/Thr phosphatase [Bacillus andreraoultii]